MRSRTRHLIVIIPILALVSDAILPALPGPVPTQAAIINVEHDPSFITLTKSAIVNGTIFNGTYSYQGYSDYPGRDFGCGPNSPLRSLRHYFDPFHEYTTTTLIFAVTFSRTGPNGTYIGLWPQPFYGLFIEVNPATGQIYNIRQNSVVCL